MKKQDEIIEQVRNLKIKFQSQGCTYQSFLSFLINNANYLMENENISNSIYFLYNNEDLYGIVIAEQESYTWCRYENDEFYELRKRDASNKNMDYEDFIIEMVIRFAESKKIESIVPEINSMNIEGKVKTLKQIGLNSKGYHFK